MRLKDIDAFLESIDNPVQYRTLKRFLDEAETVECKGDMISRQAAIAVADYTYCTGLAIEDVKKVTDEVVKGLKQLPSTQPEPCEDAVSRATLKKSFEELCDLNCPYTKKQRHIMCGSCALGSTFDALEATPSVTPKQRWIPTSDRLPKVREWVLCQCRAGIMDVLRLTEDGDWNKNYPHAEYMSGFVIAWRPLPEPYREEGGAEC